ncbi:MAG: tryptophan--tRNA ligase, partial [Candidatus Aminicenantes bacterium]|nr:tryptophan--tRNA ligase [Candidatus Aminicenantes bacterium]
FNNAINLSDRPDIIKKKIQNMFTDPRRIHLCDPGHPDQCNVFSYYREFIPSKKKGVYDWCRAAQKGCTECKMILADGLIARLKIHQEKRKSWIKNKAQLRKILNQGAQRASKVAHQTMKEMKGIIGLKSNGL